MLCVAIDIVDNKAPLGLHAKNEQGLGRPFDDPIEVPGCKPITLRDAGHYITVLPAATQKRPEWQAAVEALLLVAERGGPTMLARIGIVRALNLHHVREFNPKRKEMHGGQRKLRRDQ